MGHHEIKIKIQEYFIRINPLLLHYFMHLLCIYYYDALCIIANKTIEHGSEDFEQFLDILGQRITLYGWTKYTGGLDTKCFYPSIPFFFIY